MSNSPLVVYTKLSPNHSGKRTMPIDRITPHCVVGQCTAEGLGDWFAKSSTQASSNYGIDRDGRVGMYVEECNRSWCTSSNANDQRAITIECASDATEPYAFRDAVYEKLIVLCVDLCKRNGKSKLLWFGDKDKTLNYSPKSDEMILTVHRWFANKSCPGNWMYARMGDLAAKVTAQLAGTSPAQPETPVAPDAENVSCEKQLWDALKTYGFNDYAAAGIMGNIYAESGFRANNLQNTFEKSLGMTDKEYTAAVDNGSYTNFVRDSAGYGLAQWTYWSRKQALKDHADWLNVSIGDPSMQIDFLIKELSGYTKVMDVLKSATSVRAASDAVLIYYEAPASKDEEATQVRRAGYGQTFYEKYASDTNTNKFPDCPFTVRVIIDDLNYRSEGSMKGVVRGQTGKGVFTIVEVNESGWGRLKSGAGWIYLENPAYCTIGDSVQPVTPVKPAETFTPYKVRVSITDLNIRSGAGTDNKVVQICPPGVYTIVAEAAGRGATKWGKLKSGVGWISLDYATKL